MPAAAGRLIRKVTMADYIEPLETIIEQFRRLPGVGKKSAVRMAFGIVDMTEEEARQFSASILEARARIRTCPVCGNLCEGELCPVCDDPQRDHSVICVVEDTRALLSMERVKDYRGIYHVLGGTISPIDGRGPDDINLASLLSRVSAGGVTEVIAATNPTIDGETTALYISKMLRPTGVKVTRLAYGIPVGGDLDYADEMTLLRAIDGRKEI